MAWQGMARTGLEAGVVGVDFADDGLLLAAQAVEVLQGRSGQVERHGHGNDDEDDDEGKSGSRCSERSEREAGSPQRAMHHGLQLAIHWGWTGGGAPARHAGRPGSRRGNGN